MKPLMGVLLLAAAGVEGAQEENPLQRRTVHLTGVSDDADHGGDRDGTGGGYGQPAERFDSHRREKLAAGGGAT